MGALALLASTASATTVYVNGSISADDPANHTWKTVQKGIYDAAPGDTVWVYNGTYVENVTLANNSVTLAGESRSGVVIDRASGGGTAVVTVKADHITLENLTLKRGDRGVYADSAAYHNGTVDNVTI